MRFLTGLFLSFIILSTEVVAKSGLPVPRFVSLRSPQINVRVGPGKDYPIEWVYVRANLPVEIIAEFENWRKIRDVEGSEGWVHQSMLSGARFGLIQKQTQEIKEKPNKDSANVAKIEPEVMVRIQKCQGEWCRIQIDSIKGYLNKDALWGIYPNENLN